MLQIKEKEIIVVRFEKQSTLVNSEDYSILYSFECHQF